MSLRCDSTSLGASLARSLQCEARSFDAFACRCSRLRLLKSHPQLNRERVENCSCQVPRDGVLMWPCSCSPWLSAEGNWKSTALTRFLSVTETIKYDMSSNCQWHELTSKFPNLKLNEKFIVMTWKMAVKLPSSQNNWAQRLQQRHHKDKAGLHQRSCHHSHQGRQRCPAPADWHILVIPFDLPYHALKTPDHNYKDCGFWLLYGEWQPAKLAW